MDWEQRVCEVEKVKVTGKAASEEMKQKVILAMGNVKGVAVMEDDAEGGEGDPVSIQSKKGDMAWATSKRLWAKGRAIKKSSQPTSRF